MTTINIELNTLLEICGVINDLRSKLENAKLVRENESFVSDRLGSQVIKLEQHNAELRRSVEILKMEKEKICHEYNFQQMGDKQLIKDLRDERNLYWSILTPEQKRKLVEDEEKILPIKRKLSYEEVEKLDV